MRRYSLIVALLAVVLSGCGGEKASGPNPDIEALAYVTPDCAAEGTALSIDIRGSAESAVVVPRPFYRRR